MHPKDIVFMALCMALSAMGFLTSFLMQGQLFAAIFAGAVMLLCFIVVTMFIVCAKVPQAFRRQSWVG